MVYMILKDGFEETEAIATWDFIKRGNVDIKTVSDKEFVTGTHGLTVKRDLSFEEAELSSFKGIVLPGGQPGSDNLFNCEKTRELLKTAFEKKLLIGAICAAPYILGELGFLEGKEATCFPGFEEHLKGAEYKDEKVVVAGNIITAKGMGASLLFGKEIVKYFKGEKIAKEISQCIFSD